MAGDGGHDPAILVGVLVPVVNVGDAALAVVGDPIHGVAAEAQAGDLGQRGSAQIVRRGPFDAEFADELLQESARLQRAASLAEMESTKARAGSDSATR